ncbi:MAG: hypothetical protein JWO67_6801 [Streptosporangiaceae bacterium]|nr:hypothetical protein [Streptosporangiaceae bacterium]
MAARAFTAAHSAVDGLLCVGRGGGTFGTVLPSPEEYTEAEDAVRRLQEVLALITGSGDPDGPGQHADGA